MIHTPLHQRLGTGVDGRSCLVQNHYGRIRYFRARNRQKLPLPLRKASAVVFQHRVIPIGQTGDKVVGVGKFCRLDTLLVRSVQSAVADIFHNRTREQVGFLQNNPQRTAQVRFFNLVDIDSVIADFSVRNIVETVDKVGNGRFACARCTNEGNLLSGARIQRNIRQDLLFGDVAKVHLLHHDIPFQLSIRRGVVRLVVMFPSPKPRTLLRFRQSAVLIPLRIYQLNVAVVHLGLFVHHGEDTACAGKPHRHERNLLGHLVDDLRKVSGYAQEENDYAKPQRFAARKDVAKAIISHIQRIEQCADNGE